VQCGQCIAVCPRGTLRWSTPGSPGGRDFDDEADYAELMRACCANSDKLDSMDALSSLWATAQRGANPPPRRSRRGWDALGEITLVSPERYPMYSRPGLAYVILDEIPERQVLARSGRVP